MEEYTGPFDEWDLLDGRDQPTFSVQQFAGVTGVLRAGTYRVSIEGTKVKVYRLTNGVVDNTVTSTLNLDPNKQYVIVGTIYYAGSSITNVSVTTAPGKSRASVSKEEPHSTAPAPFPRPPFLPFVGAGWRQSPPPPRGGVAGSFSELTPSARLGTVPHALSIQRPATTPR